MNGLVLVTEPEYRKGESVFGACRDLDCQAAPAAESALAEQVIARSARAVVVGVERYRGGLYEALGRGGGTLLARFGVGHDGIDKARLAPHQITLVNTPGALDQSVAEHTLWLMGALARRVAGLDARVRGGEFAGVTGAELHGKTLGVLGLGRVGRRVAAIASQGLGMKVIAAGSRSLAEVAAAAGLAPARFLADRGLTGYTQSLEAVCGQAEVVSLHLPANPATAGLFHAATLAWLKPGALLINTARGSLLDEAALFDALATGRVAGAALDVFAREPYQPVEPDKDLRTLANVVLTPHIGSNTREANQRMAQACLDNIRWFWAGEWDRLTRVVSD